MSGGGRTALNLDDHICDGKLPARIEAVVCSRADAPGVSRLRERGYEVEIVDRTSLSADQFQNGITRSMDDVDLVCMCGFLSLWEIPDRFEGRVINIHPALLPAFGGVGMFGERVHRAVLASGVKKTGCTVHFCDREYDHGRIILQREIDVLDDDTVESLAMRVFREECIAYPEAIRMLLQSGFGSRKS